MQEKTSMSPEWIESQDKLNNSQICGDFTCEEMRSFKSTALAAKAELNLVHRLNTAPTNMHVSDRRFSSAQLVPSEPDPALPVLFHLDVLDCSTPGCYLAGWAFCPSFDAQQVILQSLFEAENGQSFVVTLAKIQRHDVAAHFADYDFSKHYKAQSSSVLNSKRKREAWFRKKRSMQPESLGETLLPCHPTALHWCGFEGLFAVSSLPKGLMTLHIRISEGSRCAGAVMKTSVMF